MLFRERQRGCGKIGLLLRLFFPPLNECDMSCTRLVGAARSGKNAYQKRQPTKASKRKLRKIARFSSHKVSGGDDDITPSARIIPNVVEDCYNDDNNYYRILVVMSFVGPKFVVWHES